MSEPRNLTLKRINRLAQAMADLMESHAAHGRMSTRLLTQMDRRLTAIDARLAAIDVTLSTLAKDLHALASEQISLGNRIEEAFARALRANVRLD
jgi:tRNA A-37 threonylcarbamoyl transferase component Bud32